MKKRNKAFYDQINTFTKSEKVAIDFMRQYFKLSDNHPITRNTRIAPLGPGFHAGINFTFAVEKAYGFELDDDEAQKIDIGTVQNYLTVLKKRKCLGIIGGSHVQN